MKPCVRLIPLGGLGEVGMNCLLMEQSGRAIMIDCGVTFPEDDNGVSVIHPDFSYLHGGHSELEAVVITHGHEDHIGALPYLLQHHNAPVYAPPYAYELIRATLAEHDFIKTPNLHRIQPNTPYDVGGFRVLHMPVTHSIRGATALAIDTQVGMVVHTGDFKIDPTPIDGVMFDEPSLRGLGDQGVRLLLSDSTNVDSSGTAGTELVVKRALEKHIEAARAAVVVAIFSSNTSRLCAVIDIARRLGKKVCPLGRSVNNHLRVAQELGLIPGADSVVIDAKEAARTGRDELVILATGTQGEEGSGLHRLAYGKVDDLELERGDTLLMSCRIIPGREKRVHDMLDALERRGIHMVTRKSDPEIHVSGHACQEEQKRMIELTRPLAFIPLHGTYHHLTRHAALASAMGVDKTLVIENGHVVEVTDDALQTVEQVPAGRVHIQGKTPISDTALADRAKLGRMGFVMLSILIERNTNTVFHVDVFSRGVVVCNGNDALFEEAKGAVSSAVQDALDCNSALSHEEIINLSTRAIRSFFRRKTTQRPLCYVMLSEKPCLS